MCVEVPILEVTSIRYHIGVRLRRATTLGMPILSGRRSFEVLWGRGQIPNTNLDYMGICKEFLNMKLLDPYINHAVPPLALNGKHFGHLICASMLGATCHIYVGHPFTPNFFFEELVQ